MVGFAQANESLRVEHVFSEFFGERFAVVFHGLCVQWEQ